MEADEITFTSLGYPKWMGATDPSQLELEEHPCKLTNLTHLVEQNLLFKHPSEVQIKTASLMNSKEHVLVQAKSGTGKTLAFLSLAAKLLDNLSEDIQNPILILAPTREIAIQINDFATLILGGFGDVCSSPLIGGIPVSDTK
jgi:superfamily II DNA/RNA helicase